MIRLTAAAGLLIVIFIFPGASADADDGLLAHWPLTHDARDVSGHSLHAQVHGVRFRASDGDNRAAAVFDGQSAWLEIPAARLRAVAGTSSDFTLCCDLFVPADADDLPGGLVSHYDAKARRGYQLSLKTAAGVTCSQSCWRQLHFGIDDRQSAERWTDQGRPGNALLAFSLCTFDGHLYAATCEPGAGETGRVWRLQETDEWIDCGAPDTANAVMALAEYNGQLYAGTGRYRLRGSSLEESPNTNPGGRVFRYEGGRRWTDCGKLPGAEAVGGLVVYRGHLYASSLYRPAGFWRYDGSDRWTDCGVPPRPKDLPGDTDSMRVVALTVYNGYLWASSYDGGRVFRWNGRRWEDCGQVGDNTQTYSFAVSDGHLYVGTWPSGKVYRRGQNGQWVSAGRLGQEREVMGMCVHNGRLIAGSLPLAQVYQYEGGTTWSLLDRLDRTPDVRYRRAWTMAEYAGQVFCSTLPSGRIFSWRAGRTAMADRSLAAGWHHVAAVRSADSLVLFTDGRLTAREHLPQDETYRVSAVTTDAPIRIGRGSGDFFCGRLRNVRIYERALSSDEIASLAGKR